MNWTRRYHIIVVGGGHAGIEAAMAAARLGKRTALVTLSIEMIGHLPCNPAVGGLGKSQIVHEVDAMGGWIGRLADRTGIQFRTLNARKGPAVWSLRTQNDKTLYRKAALNLVTGQAGLDIIQEEATALIMEKDKCCGITTSVGEELRADAVILTPGTFLRGTIFIGLHSQAAGRLAEFPSNDLSESLRNTGLTLGRLKTGTPGRIDRRSIDFSNLEEQPGDDPHPWFSRWEQPTDLPGERLRQISCHVTYTTEQTHDIIRNNLDRSPLYSGMIHGIGPRYCPSIEDKVVRFPEKDRHQIFLEPEGLDSIEVYANGISTSLPFDVQVQMIRSIDGLRDARLIRPAYAVEYDFVEPTQLTASMECRGISHLFLAGQICGTSGYEEAAGQGLIAGINAVRKIDGLEPVVLRRDQAYIGVMIDDLITRGVDEPYRMFTSRAEYRLFLRSDNADTRVTPVACSIGLLTETECERYQRRQAALDEELCRLSECRLAPSHRVLETLVELGLPPIHRHITVKEFLRRPECRYEHLALLGVEPAALPVDLLDRIMIEIKYEGYLVRQDEEIERHRRLEAIRIPESFDYLTATALSMEVRQKLSARRPRSLGQAARIPGITPAAVTVLAILLQKDDRRTSDKRKGAEDAAETE
ncbi:tRNA uridine-5-carboxymethylaminomethyl(34) synthesis enzyme MnmG [bacterium]|nr:tRNA uridine-5-carboxymethylaminomethyl(34) synthesis enzyme MnmG [candidate division CSSED10-310 bacterium]